LRAEKLGENKKKKKFQLKIFFSAKNLYTERNEKGGMERAYNKISIKSLCS
jgi:hypothetical protein